MRCVITGAAAGIGAALAKRFAAERYDVVGIDVDSACAEQTRSVIERAGGNAQFIIADLASDAEMNRSIDRITDGLTVDVLVHNAGINHVARFGASDLNIQRDVVQVNLVAPLVLTQAMLSRELVHRGSTIVFVSSLSHFLSYPGAPVYAATKDGIASFARSLAVDLRRRGIQVLTVFPGPTRTEHARRHSPDNRGERRRMSPAKLAELVYRACRKGRRRLIPGISNKLLAALGRCCPRLAERLMKRAILQKL